MGASVASSEHGDECQAEVDSLRSIVCDAASATSLRRTGSWTSWARWTANLMATSSSRLDAAMLREGLRLPPSRIRLKMRDPRLGDGRRGVCPRGRVVVASRAMQLGIAQGRGGLGTIVPDPGAGLERLDDCSLPGILLRCSYRHIEACLIAGHPGKSRGVGLDTKGRREVSSTRSSWSLGRTSR